MALSKVVFVGDGVTTDFTINFALGYIAQGDVRCRVGAEVDGSGQPQYRELSFVSDKMVRVGGAPAANKSLVTFERTVSKTSLITDFEDGDNLTGENLNQAQKQSLMVVHEIADGRFSDLSNPMDLNGQRISNGAKPVDDTDFATKGWVLDDVIQPIKARFDSQVAAAEASANRAEDKATEAATFAADARVSSVASDTRAKDAAGSAADAKASADLALTRAGAAAGSAQTATDKAAAAAASADVAVDYAEAADGRASDAAASATAAAGSASAASGSASAAAGSASSASGSAGTATQKASDAAGSASAAATSATNAKTSETNAKASADRAEAAAGGAGAGYTKGEVDTKLATKHNANATLYQDATVGEMHPWIIKRASDAQASLFVNKDAAGLYDDKSGLIWHHNFAEPGEFYVAGQRAWSDRNIARQSKAINFREKKFVLTDYGVASGNSGAVNSQAFNDAWRQMLNAGGGTVVLPTEECAYTGAVGNYDSVQVGVRVVGASPKSRMVFTGAGGQGLIVTVARPILEGFRVTSYQAPDMGPNPLILVNNVADPVDSWGQPTIMDLAVEGNPGAYPGTFLQIHNPQHARIRGLSIVARANSVRGAGSSRGLLITASPASNKSSVGDFSADGVCIFGAYVGIEVSCGGPQDGSGIVTPTVEGSSFTDCSIVGGSVGLSVHSDGYRAPGYSWKGGHINVVDTLFWLRSISQFTIADTQGYLNNAVTGNSGFVYLNDSSDCHIRHNKFFIAPENGQSPIDQTVYGVSIDGGGERNRIEGNDFIGMNNSSPMVRNTGSGGSNRAMGNGRTGAGTQLSGNVGNMYGNHQI